MDKDNKRDTLIEDEKEEEDLTTTQEQSEPQVVMDKTWGGVLISAFGLLGYCLLLMAATS